MANNANGNPSATPKPAAPAVSGQAPCSATPTSSVPKIGPVQEKETIASVPAIKKIPHRFPKPDLESILFARPDGKPISKNPKKEIANTTKITKNKRFNHIL